jgi:hypothetical protein
VSRGSPWCVPADRLFCRPNLQTQNMPVGDEPKPFGDWVSQYEGELLPPSRLDEGDWDQRYQHLKAAAPADQAPPPTPGCATDASLEADAAMAGWSAADLADFTSSLEEDLASAGWSPEDLQCMLDESDEFAAPASAPAPATAPTPAPASATAPVPPPIPPTIAKAVQPAIPSLAGLSNATANRAPKPAAARVTIGPDGCAVVFPYSPQSVKAVKAVGGGGVARWVGRSQTNDAGHWHVPAIFAPQLLAAFPGATVNRIGGCKAAPESVATLGIHRPQKLFLGPKKYCLYVYANSIRM